MRPIAILLLVALSATAAGQGGPSSADTATYAAWRPLLAAELARGSVDSPRDLYKFLHQGVLGPAHAVPDAAHARGWLDREWAELDELAAAGRPPLLLPLRPDGRLARLDLVRLRDLARGDESTALDTVAAAFASTGQRWPRDPELLAGLWTAAVADSALWRGRIAPAELASFTRELEGAWPAVHHSDAYRRRNAPHYRVVDPRLLPAAWRLAEGRP